MLTVQNVSELIGGLYDCVVDPSKWEQSLDAIRTELNFANAVLGANALPSGETSIAISVGIAPEWIARMPGYGTEIMRAWGGVARIQAYPLDEPILQSQATSPQQLRGNRWITEWGEPQGLINAVTIPFARDPTMIGNLTCGRHRTAGDIREDELAILRIIAPHVRRAVVIGRLLEQQTVAATTFSSALEIVSAGVILVDESLRIVHANHSAGKMLTIGDTISSRNEVLELRSALANNALRTAVRQASKSELELGSRGINIPLRRPGGGAAVAHVLPLRRKGIRQGLVQHASAAIFIAPGREPKLPADAIALLYDLTPAELRVFELITDGHTPREIARLLSIAISTVRTHLIRVFEKTGCNRQANLVKLASSLSAAL
jgi:DNA-binding CsgD family transcriptional regulator